MFARDLYNVRSMLNSYVPTTLASWLFNNNNIYISNYIKEPEQSWPWRQHLSRFDIRENQKTLSRSVLRGSVNGNGVYRACTSKVSNQIVVT